MHSYLTNLCLEFERRFENHVATLEAASDTLQRIVWGNRNGSSVFQCVYVLDTSRGATLTITGDLFSGVFRWIEPQGWRFFRDINFDYFMEKCRAADCSCLGRKGRSWDSFAALRKLDSTWREELPGDVIRARLAEVERTAGTALAEAQELHGDVVTLRARLAEVEADRDRYRRALEDVKRHLDTIRRGTGTKTTTYRIITRALEG